MPFGNETTLISLVPSDAQKKLFWLPTLAKDERTIANTRMILSAPRRRADAARPHVAEPQFSAVRTMNPAKAAAVEMESPHGPVDSASVFACHADIVKRRTGIRAAMFGETVRKQ
jgi:hypothetical protein